MPQNTGSYVDRSLKLLQDGLTPFVERQLKSRFGGVWQDKVTERLKDSKAWNSYGFLKIMNSFWKDVFAHLQNPARSYVNEIIHIRNRWAHQEDFTHEDADRALDTMRRLLMAIGNQDHASKIHSLRKEMSPASTEKTIFTESPRILKDLHSVSTQVSQYPSPCSSPDNKPKYTRKFTVKQIACDLLCETIEANGQQVGLSFDEILKKVKERFPDAKTSQNSLNCYQSHIRQGKQGYDQWTGKLPPDRLPD